MAGFWRLDWLPGYDHTTLHVLREVDGTWSLRFYRSWCMGRELEEVHARSTEGVLVLDGPAWPFGAEPLCVLVPARIDGRECLVPDQFLGNVGVRSPEPPKTETETGWTFVRLEVADPDGFHERWKAAGSAAFDFGTTGMQPNTEDDGR
jgi:hypothetical protein